MLVFKRWFISFQAIFLFISMLTSINSSFGNNMTCSNKTVEIDSSRLVVVKGNVYDLMNDKGLAGATVRLIGSKNAVATDTNGDFYISEKGAFEHISIKSLGYKEQVQRITDEMAKLLRIGLEPEGYSLDEIVINAPRRFRYNNNNKAVEIIRLIIENKHVNRREETEYIQYRQYERIDFSLINLSDRFLNGKRSKKYAFLRDTVYGHGGIMEVTVPVYASEKVSERYFRHSPKKMVNILKDHREVDFGKYIDTAGFDYYLNRLYNEIDIYDNDLFVLSKQFLSPIADNAPSYYKYYIVDTLKSEGVIEVDFYPRVKESFLFSGKLYVTMDGKYAMQKVKLHINKDVNVNFVHSMDIDLNFTKSSDGKYYLSQNISSASFGINSKKAKIKGVRSISYDDYLIGLRKSDDFYNGTQKRTELYTQRGGDRFWEQFERSDQVNPGSTPYRKLDSLNNMPSFRRLMWVGKTLVGGYGDFGPFQAGPVDALYAFNNVEGHRLRIGGRTTPTFHRSIYLEGYAAYGTRDKKLKYYGSALYSFNGEAPYRYPNHYLSMSYQHDTDLPGQNFLIDRSQSLLASIYRMPNNFWQYNNTLRIDYAREYENHFSIRFGYKYLRQRPAGSFSYHKADDKRQIADLSSSMLTFKLRYAPNEKIFQGQTLRRVIPSPYPIFTLNGEISPKDVMGNRYGYFNLSASAYKRFYLSQFGYSDVTLSGGRVFGEVPFPLLNVIPANQTFLYEKNVYNMVNLMEFVADRYVGLNVSHSFQGYLFNRIPLVKKLGLRELLSFKMIYGALGAQNDPTVNEKVFGFPVSSSGEPLTHALGQTPYMEVGFGVTNIFKIMHISVIRRLNYLNHHGATPWGIRFSFVPEF